jgi:para-nitrobenzyl esterase
MTRTALATTLALTLPYLAASQGVPTREQLAGNPALFLDLARKTLKWDEPAAPVKIVGPIYSVGTKGLSVFLITTTEGHIIINSAMPGSGPMTEAAIRTLGLDPRDIKLLLAGHAHSDHVGAHAYLQKISGAKVAVIREEKALLESGGKLDFHYAAHREFDFDPVKADWEFRDGDVIKLGDVAITALLTNGHTKGSTTFVMNVVDAGKAYTVVIPNGLSINPGYRLARDPSYPGIAGNFRRTLNTLDSLEPDIWLAPHTETYGFEAKVTRTATEGVRAWVDPGGYRAWLAEQRENFEATVAAELGNTPVAVSTDNFVRAETDRYFADTARTAFGKLGHRRAMAAIDKQDVVRMNRDTLYSSGVFDLAAAPVTITLPDAGKRFMSMQVISEDHYTTEVVYAPGTFTYARENVGTRYVYVIVRTLANPEDAADLKAAHALQDAITVAQADTGTFVVPNWDQVSLGKARGALTALAATGSAMTKFGTKTEVDPIGHLIGAAIGWGGNPESAAIYHGVFPAANDGKVPHQLTVADVPVDGFWSLSVYNDKGFFEKNASNAYSVNSLTAKPDADGSVTVRFGGCEKRQLNCLPIMPGWNYTVRLYRPRAAILDGSWTFPVAAPVK